MTVKSFVFNPFQQNTYLVWDETGECLIIDPGCYDRAEQKELTDFIESKSLKPVKLLNTHCHVDHVFGNHFVFEKYGLLPEMNKKDLPVLDSLMTVAQMYGLNATPSPQPKAFLDEGDRIRFGKSELDILFTPGHSPGSLCFYNEKEKIVIAGDVLFNGSIGRSDLPGGDHETLISSIKNKLMKLPDDCKVYSGHGQETTIGFERRTNPFLQ